MNKKTLEKLGLTAEALEKAGLEPEVLNKIIIEHGKDIEKHKTDLEAAQTTAENLQTQLDEANKQIKGFKEMDIESVKKSAEDWEAKAKTAQQEADEQIKQMKFAHALDGALTAAKVKDPVSVKAHLKVDDLKLAEDGSIVGLNEQLESLIEEKDYLFDSEKPDPKIVTNTNNTTVVGDAFEAAMRKGAGLEDKK